MGSGGNYNVFIGDYPLKVAAFADEGVVHEHAAFYFCVFFNGCAAEKNGFFNFAVNVATVGNKAFGNFCVFAVFCGNLVTNTGIDGSFGREKGFSYFRLKKSKGCVKIVAKAGELVAITVEKIAADVEHAFFLHEHAVYEAVLIFACTFGNELIEKRFLDYCDIEIDVLGSFKFRVKVKIKEFSAFVEEKCRAFFLAENFAAFINKGDVRAAFFVLSDNGAKVDVCDNVAVGKNNGFCVACFYVLANAVKGFQSSAINAPCAGIGRKD